MGLILKNINLKTVKDELGSVLNLLGLTPGRIPKKPYVFHTYSYSFKTMRSLLREAGFEVIEIRNAVPAAEGYYKNNIKGSIRLAKYIVYGGANAVSTITAAKPIFMESLLLLAAKKTC